MPIEKAQSSAMTSTVLVVDDHKDAVDIVARLLSHHGITALRAYSGQECLEIVRSRSVDVIVLDVMMRMSLGVSEFMVKPVNNRDLITRIQTQLNNLKWAQDIDKTSAIMEPSPKQ
jgi:DNA-binding response OmpR family regulator